MLQFYNEETETLTIPHYFNEELTEIPTNAKIIIFRDNVCDMGQYSKFNQKIKKNTFPLNLTQLKFGYVFNQEIEKDILPSKLTHLTFGATFKQEIKKDILPNSLVYLEFGIFYDTQILKNILPTNLIHLKFGSSFNQEIHGVIPPNVKEITLWINKKIIENLPENVETLNIICFEATRKKIINNLPMTIKKIRIKKKEYMEYIEKIPFGCMVTDMNDKEIHFL